MNINNIESKWDTLKYDIPMIEFLALAGKDTETFNLGDVVYLRECPLCGHIHFDEGAGNVQIVDDYHLISFHCSDRTGQPIDIYNLVEMWYPGQNTFKVVDRLWEQRRQLFGNDPLEDLEYTNLGKSKGKSQMSLQGQIDNNREAFDKSLKDVAIYADQTPLYDYWNGRGIIKETVDKMGIKLGSVYGKTKMLIPTYFGDNMVGVKTREGSDFSDKRWVKASSTKAGFGLQHIKEGDEVLVVEGEACALTAIQLGVKAVSTHGTSNMLGICEILLGMGCTPIVFFDNDEAGHKTGMKCKEQLGVEAWWTGKAKDLSELYMKDKAEAEDILISLGLLPMFINQI